MRKGIWQPIETAPKDGNVDLYTDWAHTRDCNCHWDGKRWVTWGRDGRRPGWEEIPSPTHWMPLPDPPETKKGNP